MNQRSMPMNDKINTQSNSGIRETYTEYAEGETVIAKIADPDDTDAWITSTLTYAIEE